MTYCIGVKSAEVVYLAADSAVTSSDEPRIERTSFGEKHSMYRGPSTGRYVQEGKLKLYSMDRVAITFSGDVDVGEFVVRQLQSAIAAGNDLFAAFNEATSSRAVAEKAKFVLAFLRNGMPTLAESTPEGATIHENDGTLIQFGSINSAYQDLTRKLVDSIRERSTSPPRFIAQLLAILQSYGTHDYLIEQGVGGGFCGLYLDHHGVHWQPDMFYSIIHPQLETVGYVGSLVREEVWCLFTTLISECPIFAHRRDNESAEIARQRVSDVSYELTEKFDNGVFDYAAILNIGRHIVCVVEMLGNRDHELIRIEPHPKIQNTLGVYWSPELLSKINTIPQQEGVDEPPRDFCLWFLPYRVPLTELSSQLRDELRANPANTRSSE